MGFVFICFIGLAIIATIIYVIDDAYFSNKKPEETLEEIDENIFHYGKLFNESNDIEEQETILDMKEYWEEQRKKLLK